MKAAEEASKQIMRKAEEEAAEAAKTEAKKEIDKLLHIKPLPPGVKMNGTQSRFLEEPNIHAVVKKVLSAKMKITDTFWKATGESVYLGHTQRRLLFQERIMLSKISHSSNKPGLIFIN